MYQNLQNIFVSPYKITTSALLYIFLAYLAIRIPFLLTHHVQEDAFIAMRAGLNFFEYGIPSFNIGEIHNPITSIIWAIILYVLGVFNPFYLELILATNILVVFLAAKISADSLRDNINIAWLLALLFSSPLLWSSYNGMETCIAIYYVAFSFYVLRREKFSAGTGFILSFFPLLIRPDLGFVFLLFCLTHLDRIFRQKNYLYGLLCGGLMGLSIFFGFHQWSSGQWLPITALAKNLSYAPSRDLFSAMHRWLQICSSSLIWPKTNSIPAFIYLVLNFLPLAFIFCRKFLNSSTLFLYFIGYVFSFIICYFGGYFEWYFQPSGFAIMLLYMTFGVTILSNNAKIIFFICTYILVIVTLFLQFLISFNTGFQEKNYRAGIGKWLKINSKPTDTLLLEPAGYIPYYSGLKTYDEIGLVSSDVFHYLKLYGGNWWPRFVKDFCPTYIVERDPLTEGKKTGSGYMLNHQDEKFLSANYSLFKHFSYNPKDFTSNKFSLRLLITSHSDYYVYRRAGNCK